MVRLSVDHKIETPENQVSRILDSIVNRKMNRVQDQDPGSIFGFQEAVPSFLFLSPSSISLTLLLRNLAIDDLISSGSSTK